MSKLVGGLGAEWSIAAQVRVSRTDEGAIVSLSLSSDTSELLVGTSAGQIFRLLAEDFSLSHVASSHVGPVAGCAFHPTSSDVFATVGQDGHVCVWDLSDYSILAQAQGHCPATCLAFSSVETSVVLLTGMG